MESGWFWQELDIAEGFLWLTVCKLKKEIEID